MDTRRADAFGEEPIPSSAPPPPPPYTPYESADIIDDYLDDRHDQQGLVVNTRNLTLQNVNGKVGHLRHPHQNQDAPLHPGERHQVPPRQDQHVPLSSGERHPLPRHQNQDAPSTPGTRPPMPPRPATVPLVPSAAEASADSTAKSSNASSSLTKPNSFWQNAVDALVSHPFESNNHFSILRHSSGLIFYKGPETSVAITIFSDAPLPSDRSLWLQRRGYSGNLGMNASALFRTSSNWVDVTPAYEAVASDMPEADERIWQRDMAKFAKKAAKEKQLSRQDARETCVVRIPAAAEDGYLRILLCTGEGKKKVLCPSPVFRVASTSSDVSVFRGASLTSMPLEVGLKAASVIGTTVANRYIGPAKMVVESRVGKAADKLMEKHKPNFVVKKAEHIALAKSHLKGTFDTLEQNYDSARDVLYDRLHTPDVPVSPPEVIGLDSGPESPFPIRLDGKVTQGTGQGQLRTGTPTANLSGVSNDLLLRLNGIYIGWASVQPMKGLNNVSHDWHEAIITVGPSPYAAPRVVPRNVATVHIIHDFGVETFYNTKLKVVIMAYLRPMPKPDNSIPQSDLAEAITKDINIALASLSREHWGSEITVERWRTERGERSTAEKYVDARVQLQKRVDNIPLHIAGVRTAGAAAMDKAHGNGGIWIRR